MTTQPDAGLSDVMSGRANELLTEMKHLRAEMKKLLIVSHMIHVSHDHNSSSTTRMSS